MSLDRVAGIGTAGGEAFGNAEVVWGEERSAATAMLDTIFAFIFTILDRCRIRHLDSATAMCDVRMEAVSRAEMPAAACQGPLSDALRGEAHEVPAIAILCELAQLCRASAIGTRLLGIDRLDLLLHLCDRGSLQMQRLVLRLVRDVTHGRTKAISSHGLGRMPLSAGRLTGRLWRSPAATSISALAMRDRVQLRTAASGTATGTGRRARNILRACEVRLAARLASRVCLPPARPA